MNNVIIFSGAFIIILAGVKMFYSYFFHTLMHMYQFLIIIGQQNVEINKVNLRKTSYFVVAFSYLYIGNNCL